MTLEEYRKRQADDLNRLDMPSLGDASKVYQITLTEPEINAIHAALGFIRSACAAAGLKRFWGHYGGTIEELSERLRVFDDATTGGSPQ